MVEICLINVGRLKNKLANFHMMPKAKQDPVHVFEIQGIKYEMHMNFITFNWDSRTGVVFVENREK